MSITGNFKPSSQPSRDEPHRAIDAKVETRTVHGTYQCVLDMPEFPTRADLYNAFVKSLMSICELARRWRDDEERSGRLNEGGPTTSYRLVFDMRLIPEKKRESRV